jgi:hypothetical protein
MHVLKKVIHKSVTFLHLLHSFCFHLNNILLLSGIPAGASSVEDCMTIKSKEMTT